MDGKKSQRIHEKLLRELGPVIAEALYEIGVVEIALNPDGFIWVKKNGVYEKRGSMNAEAAESLMGTIASCLHTTVTRDNPILEGELPIDGSRFEGLLPPVVAYPTFTIRRKAAKIYTLEDYVTQKVLTRRQCDILIQAVKDRQNVIVAGGTSTGKTTFLNAFIHQIHLEHPAHRLITIEDTSELQNSAPNSVALHTSDTVDMQRLLKVTMRLNPDRILVGETRGGEALALLKSWNTGHSGGAASLHANDAVGALLRLEQLIREATEAPMHHEISHAVNFVVVIAYTPEVGRHISEIVRVTGYDTEAQKYKYELLT
jgi:type IV secretion system protein VirB11